MPQAKQTIKVIAKIEHWKDAGSTIILFFPEQVANQGFIQCYTYRDMHNEAANSYLSVCEPATTPAEHIMINAAIAAYEHTYDVKLKRMQRDSKKMQQTRWGKG